ncbi:MAG: hypothetical protein ACWA5R_12140, partial [bacterium]
MNDMSVKIKLIRVFVLALLLTSSAAYAIKFPEKPSNEHYYVDLVTKRTLKHESVTSMRILSVRFCFYSG